MGPLRRQVPMLHRITGGRTDLVFDFVGAGKPATFRDADGASLISTCSYYGDVSAIRFLLLQGERLESLGTNLGLDSAAFHGHWQLCEFLLERGADANYADPNPGDSTSRSTLHGESGRVRSGRQGARWGRGRSGSVDEARDRDRGLHA